MFRILSLGLLLLSSIAAHPLSSTHQSSVRTDKFYIRLMPLGASITVGLHSTDLNGYRKHLRDHLTSAGWPVNMVGTEHGGNMTDNVSFANSMRKHRIQSNQSRSNSRLLVASPLTRSEASSSKENRCNRT
jgi:hypothetical protein